MTGFSSFRWIAPAIFTLLKLFSPQIKTSYPLIFYTTERYLPVGLYVFILPSKITPFLVNISNIAMLLIQRHI